MKRHSSNESAKLKPVPVSINFLVLTCNFEKLLALSLLNSKSAFIACWFVILLTPFSTFADSTLDHKVKQAQKLNRYNYNAVCLFIDFMKSKLQEPAISNQDNSSSEFKYEKNGVTGIYAKKNNLLVNVKSVFKGTTLQTHMRTKSYLLSIFEIENKMISDSIELGCDAETLILNFKDNNLVTAEITADFID